MVGIYLRTFPQAYAPMRMIDMSPVNYAKSHGSLGDFAIEGVEDKDLLSLRLKMSRCQDPLFFYYTDYFDLPPARLTSLIYPASQWTIVRMQNNKLIGPISRWDMVRFLIRKKFDHLFLMLDDPLDRVIFTLAVPHSCAFESKDALNLVQNFIASLKSSDHT